MSFVICNAQDIIDPQPLQMTFRSRFSGLDTTGILSTKYFPQDKFIMGWQWGQNPRITAELSSNMYQCQYWEQAFDSIPDYVPPYKIYTITGAPDNFPYNSESIQWEPTLKIQSSTPPSTPLRMTLLRMT